MIKQRLTIAVAIYAVIFGPILALAHSDPPVTGDISPVDPICSSITDTNPTLNMNIAERSDDPVGGADIASVVGFNEAVSDALGGPTAPTEMFYPVLDYDAASASMVVTTTTGRVLDVRILGIHNPKFFGNGPLIALANIEVTEWFCVEAELYDASDPSFAPIPMFANIHTFRSLQRLADPPSTYFVPLAPDVSTAESWGLCMGVLGNCPSGTSDLQLLEGSVKVMIIGGLLVAAITWLAKIALERIWDSLSCDDKIEACQRYMYQRSNRCKDNCDDMIDCPQDNSECRSCCENLYSARFNECEVDCGAILGDDPSAWALDPVDSQCVDSALSE